MCSVDYLSLAQLNKFAIRTALAVKYSGVKQAACSLLCLLAFFTGVSETLPAGA